MARFGDRTMRCAVGWGGRGVKLREGDGVTPAGRHRIDVILFRPDHVRPPRGPAARSPIRPGDGWSDALQTTDYDCLVRRPSAQSHETLWRTDALYDVVCVLDWRAGRSIGETGSAMFLHCARADFRPTAGCVALVKDDLIAVLAEMASGDRVVIRAESKSQDR